MDLDFDHWIIQRTMIKTIKLLWVTVHPIQTQLLKSKLCLICHIKIISGHFDIIQITKRLGCPTEILEREL